MRYAIVESGGKQYQAVEGETIEVDRLPVDAGENISLERVLMLVDGDNISVGTPTVDGIQVSTTVVAHFKGPKIIVFKYRPRKRVRVKGGHRQQYTRLLVDVIGKPGESRKVTKGKTADAPAVKKAEVKAEKKVEKKEATAQTPVVEKAPATSSSSGKKAPAKVAEKAPTKKSPAKKTEKAPAKKVPAKKTEKVPATISQKGKKAPAKKTTAKKTTTTSSPKGKKTSSTKTTKK